jgi:hypothetical protein
MSGLPHPKYFKKGVVMPSNPTAEDIRQQLEALVLAAILNVLNRLTQQLSEISQQEKMKF